MDIDKLILGGYWNDAHRGFSSLMDIDKLILGGYWNDGARGFSSLMDIDKLILERVSLCDTVF